MAVESRHSDSGGDGRGSRPTSSGSGGGTKLGRRLGAALSHADFERCDPSTCVSVLHVATIQVASPYSSDSDAVAEKNPSRGFLEQLFWLLFS